MINFAVSEIGIDFSNPFGKVYYDRNAGVEKRVPLPIETIRSLQKDCRRIDDDLRWLIALVSDTGMRLDRHHLHQDSRWLAVSGGPR